MDGKTDRLCDESKHPDGCGGEGALEKALQLLEDSGSQVIKCQDVASVVAAARAEQAQMQAEERVVEFDAREGYLLASTEGLIPTAIPNPCCHVLGVSEGRYAIRPLPDEPEKKTVRPLQLGATIWSESDGWQKIVRCKCGTLCQQDSTTCWNCGVSFAEPRDLPEGE